LTVVHFSHCRPLFLSKSTLFIFHRTI
jgi:hypothetical protein